MHQVCNALCFSVLFLPTFLNVTLLAPLYDETIRVPESWESTQVPVKQNERENICIHYGRYRTLKPSQIQCTNPASNAVV